MKMKLTETEVMPPLAQSSQVGFLFKQDLTFDEWHEIGKSLSIALNSTAWAIGDWMIYGERRWGSQLILEGKDFDPKTPDRISSAFFDKALKETSLDRQTLSNYASVCRKIPVEERSPNLSFAHHRLLAPLPAEKRKEWMELLDSESNKTSVKRLALSLKISEGSPRVVSEDDISTRGENDGHNNYIPHLLRLLTVLRQTMPDMDSYQLEALKKDTAQLRGLLNDM